MKDVYYIVVSSKQTRKLLRRIRTSQLLDRSLIFALGAYSLLLMAGIGKLSEEVAKMKDTRETADAQ